MKIALWGMKDWEQDYVKKALGEGESELVFYEGQLKSDNLPPQSDFEIICVFVDSTVNKAVLDNFQNLKGVVTRSTGYDHVDLKECASRNIVVSSVPSYGENTVAEFAFALILALSRKVYAAVDNFRETGKYSFEGLMGFDLKGKTIGVIGTGRIGKYSIKIAKGFGMNVVGYDAFPNEAMSKELDFPYMSFEEVLKISDVVTIHVPALPETEHMFNEKTIPLMKKGALLVNTARGSVVKTEALVAALQSGHLAGAGLDVLEEEGVLKDEVGFVLNGDVTGHNVKIIVGNHVLADMPNVLLTPHAAFDTKEAIMRILDTTVEDIKGISAGKPVNIVLVDAFAAK
ncbi:MAG: NAD(P)-dependent oxidoreductase [bacterium]|nr:NAD(P)-dependent oxidoreductase [bacterium]